MQNLNSKASELVIKLNIEDLTPAQVRLLKSINALVTSVVSADEESEYFEASAELMKKTAELIRVANFPKTQKNMDYGSQAVEYAVDFLNDEESKESIDN